MAMIEIIKRLEKEILRQQKDEQMLLNKIAAVSSLEFAERAADILNPKKHLYDREVYLLLLENLNVLLIAGMSGDFALESIQSGYDAKTILAIWRTLQSWHSPYVKAGDSAKKIAPVQESEIGIGKNQKRKVQDER